MTRRTTAADVGAQLTAVEDYAKRAIEQGAVVPELDRGWRRRIDDLRTVHDRWAQVIGLPKLGNIDALAPWAKQLPFDAANLQTVGAWIAHVDAVRTVQDLWSAVRFPVIDHYWPINVRPHHLPVPAAAWRAADGGADDNSWVDDLIVRLHEYEPEAAADPGWARRMLRDGFSDLIGELPALLAAAWSTAHVPAAPPVEKRRFGVHGRESGSRLSNRH